MKDTDLEVILLLVLIITVSNITLLIILLEIKELLKKAKL